MSKIYFLLIPLIMIVDYQTKVYINKILDIGDYYNINEYVIFNKVFNKGLVFGIGHTDSILYKNIIIFSIFLILLIIIYWFITNKENFSKISMLAWCCLIGGGISNFIDRLFNGHVTDFIILHYNNYFFPGIFNIADIFITFAVLLLIIELGFNYEQKS